MKNRNVLREIVKKSFSNFLHVEGLVVQHIYYTCNLFWDIPLQVGDRSFPLEAVRELKELMELEDGLNPHLAETSSAAVCAHPLLPQVFRPVCQGKGAGIIFSRLGKERMLIINAPFDKLQVIYILTHMQKIGLTTE